MLSCEIFEIFKNTYFEEHPGTTASEKPEAAVQMCSLESCSRKLIEIYRKNKRSQWLVFSCDFCEISQSTFFTQELKVVASVIIRTYGSTFVLGQVKYLCSKVG